MVDGASKFSVQQILAYGGLLIFGVALLILIFLLIDRPFIINGQEYGFNASSIEKRTNDLNDCKTKMAENADSFSSQLMLLTKENSVLREQNEKMELALRSYRNHDNKLWFPVEDLSFNELGNFEELNSKRKGEGF